ncbi:hypothetical protein [Parasitella parasitica]|uniref:NADH dehydrogenase [ubiquinone] iron-sulfur protein 5 n=1 Tax=Parasitella parasitica TaxID=35722 RepID=A0A0B7MYE7_9FUNG|nr:hypothetical protein [Parasitella parasitica]
MASGFGLDGGRGRCFHFWQEFNKCYATADLPQQCLDQRDDYLECLHHTKEFARITRIKTEELKQAEKKKHELEKQQKDALAAAKSNLPKLNIIDDKASAKAQ